MTDSSGQTRDLSARPFPANLKAGFMVSLIEIPL